MRRESGIRNQESGIAFLIPFIISSCFFLSACGFEPLHGQHYRTQFTTNLSSVAVTVDHSRRGQLLESEIKRGINPDSMQAEKLYALKIKLAEREIPLFINPDGTSSRGDIDLTSQYKLTRIIDNKVIQQGTIKRVSSYNTSESADYASYVSEEDAKTRGIIELAEAYKLRLANLLPGLSGQAVIPASGEAPQKPPEEITLPRRIIP